MLGKIVKLVISNKRLILDFMLIMLIGVGAIKLLEWSEDYRDSRAAVEQAISKPKDGQITNNDIDLVSGRLKCEINTRSEGFRITQIRGGGNDYESYLSLKSCYVESDFLTAYDGTIVSAHDDTDADDCGLISQSDWQELRNCKNARGHSIATLKDFLRLPLSEWFIDLKSTQSNDSKYVTAVVKQAVEVIQDMDRQNGAVLMIYNAPPEAVEIIKSNNIRAGLKGYPRSHEEVRQMVNTASSIGFEMICVNITYINKEMIEYSNSKNVWHLPWAVKEYEFPYWQNLIDWGAGGLITAYVGWAQSNLEF